MGDDRARKKRKCNDIGYELAIDIAPLEIINDNDDIVARNTDEIILNLFVTVHHLTQYWEVINDDHKKMVASIPSINTSETSLHTANSVFDSDNNDDHDIMSLLWDLDVLYEIYEVTCEQLEELKRKIISRISEAKAHIHRVKPKAVRTSVDISHIVRKYFGSSADALSAAAEHSRNNDAAVKSRNAASSRDPPYPRNYDDHVKPASRASVEALEDKIFGKEDLLISVAAAGVNNPSSSSSLMCPVCLKEFRMGVDRITKMPCSHSFHLWCISPWLLRRNTCPVCRYEIPTWKCFSTDR